MKLLRAIFPCIMMITSGCGEDCNTCEKVIAKYDRSVYLHGKISAKYLDSSYGARMQPRLLMENGYVYKVHIHDLYSTVVVGDSLIKDAGKLSLYIIRKNTHDSDFFYASCCGYEIK